VTCPRARTPRAADGRKSGGRSGDKRESRAEQRNGTERNGKIDMKKNDGELKKGLSYGMIGQSKLHWKVGAEKLVLRKGLIADW